MSLRERHLSLAQGEVLLRVGLHEVQVLLAGDPVGRLQFRALGSANSDEPPVYRLLDIALEPYLQAEQEAIMAQAVALFSEYTGARVVALKR